MDIKTYTPTIGATLRQGRTEIRRLMRASRNVFASWTGPAFRRMRDAILSVFRGITDDRRNRLVFRELNRMSDYELADIGLSRSDLTLDGLAIAGSKRARKQDAVAKEIASLSRRNGAIGNGD